MQASDLFQHTKNIIDSDIDYFKFIINTPCYINIRNIKDLKSRYYGIYLTIKNLQYMCINNNYLCDIELISNQNLNTLYIQISLHKLTREFILN